MSNLRSIIRRGTPVLLLACGISPLIAYSDPPASVANGPQLVGTPVASSGISNRLTLPTITVNPGEALVTCTKAPGTVSVPVTDDHGNVWKEIQPVASGSSNSIHISLALTPSTGLTTVRVNDGNCPQCYAASILMKLTNVHAITTATGNPYSTPASDAMQVTNGPITLNSAKARLMLACSEIEWAPNTNLSFGAWPYTDDGADSGSDPGLVATTFVQSPNSKYTGLTLNATVEAVTTAGTFEIDLPFSPAGNQAGGLVVLE
jgi:hypothetical protein